MNISPRNGLKRSSEPIDEFLKTEGYFRKNAPHDATCLFRAVSEQIYLTQYYHLRVRQQCVNYMRKNKELFEESVKIPYDSYLEQLSCVNEWGGNLEIQAMSKFYKRDFVIFNAQKLDCTKATDNGFEKSIYLCQLTARVYKSVFKREIMSTAAFCQSLVYQTLYKKVFNLPEIDDTVKKMLHDRTNIRDNRFSCRSNLDQRSQHPSDLFSKNDSDSSEASKAQYEKAPFPYRIAKALDPNIYRNIDFDIWHEIRREVRRAGWTRWNDSELRIGAKCLVQLDDNRENVDDSNNNNVDLSMSKKVPALLFGHIQEMGKDEGPVVVFIEALGEKRRVPYSSLKPVLATRNPQLPLGVVSPRKNWRNKWIQSNKPKDITSIMLNSIDSLNNNDYDKKKKSGEWSDDNILKNFTGMENFSSANDFGEAVEVRPVSIVLDNQVGGEQKGDDKPVNCNNNSTMINNNNIGQESYEKRESDGGNLQMGMMQPTSQPSPVPQHQEAYYSPSAPPMFAPNTNVMCVSSEGAMYPVQYYSGGQGEVPPPPGPDRGLRPVNITAPFSIDINGNDLPYSDPSTLRFFYNLGIEAFRYGHMWQPGQLAYGSAFLPPANVVPVASPAVPADVPQPLSLQMSPRNEENGGRQGQQRRRPDQSGNSGRNSGMSGDGRGSRNFTRKGENEGNFQRNETPTVPHDYQKNRGYGNNEEKEGNQRKNTQGRYKKNNNEGFSNSSFPNRSRNFDRNPQFQQDFQKPRETPPSSFRNENHSFNRGRAESSQQSPQQSAANQFQQYGQQQQQQPQPVFNSVQYYSESENFYPPNPNFYPVPLMPPPEAPESNAGPYVCTGPDNYPPPMSPMYSPYVYPPPPIYQGVPGNHQDNWYPLPGNQSQYVPYQVPVTQPPPNISNRPPTTS